MIRITEEQIRILHDKGIMEFGGMPGIRDEKLFKSCCVAPYQTMFGEDLFPDIYDKAIKYLEAFATNQVFFDGNKRTATAAMMLLLRMNGVSPCLSNEQLASICLKLVKGEISKEKIKELLKQA